MTCSMACSSRVSGPSPFVAAAAEAAAASCFLVRVAIVPSVVSGSGPAPYFPRQQRGAAACARGSSG